MNREDYFDNKLKNLEVGQGLVTGNGTNGVEHYYPTNTVVKIINEEETVYRCEVLSSIIPLRQYISKEDVIVK